jgi:carbon storage regulator
VLVLTRRAGESIVIGDEVRVVVLDVRGDTVRLGIDAPRSVQVHRAEVYAEVQAANAAAATSSDDLGSVADRLARMARAGTPRRPRPKPRGGTPATADAVPEPAAPDSVPEPAAPDAAPSPKEPAPVPGPPLPKPGPPRPSPPPRRPADG